MGGDEAPPPAGVGIKPFVSLKRHPFLALFVAISVASLGVPVALMKGKPSYYVAAALYVSPQFPPNLQRPEELRMDSTTQYRQFVHQQASTITRFDILQTAFDRLPDWLKEEYWPGGASKTRAIQILQSSLAVEPIKDTYLIRIGLSGDEPEGLAETVNTVVEAYLEVYRKEHLYGVPERVSHLQARRDKLTSELTTSMSRMTTIGDQLGMTTFEPLKTTPYDEALTESQNKLSSARRSRIEAEAKLRALTSNIERVNRIDLMAVAARKAADDPSLGEMRGQLFRRRSELFITLAGLAGGHPARPSMEQEIEDIDAELERITSNVITTLRDNLETERKSESKAAVSRAAAELEEKEITEREYAKIVSEQRSRVHWFGVLYSEARDLQAKVGTLRSKIDRIDQRVDQLTLEEKSPGVVRLSTPARYPEIPTGGGKKKFLLLFAVAGLGIGLVAPTAIDLLDRRIHAPNDVEKLLGFAPVGWALERGEPGTETYARDQMRRLALAIDRDRRRSGTNEITMTGVEVGEGTTTLAFDLAAELTSIGVPTLAVEVNAFRPDERYHGDTVTAGLAGVLRGEVSAKDVIAPPEGRLPARVPLGATESQHLPNPERFPGVLRELSEDFAMVLLDGPPLLLSADAELLTEVTQATLLVISAEGVAPGQIKRAAKVLERLNPPVVGTVVNRVKVLDGGGYFATVREEYESRLRPAPGLLEKVFWS